MKKKKKIPTLPYDIQPIIPDKVDGVAKFNELSSNDTGLSEAKLSSKEKSKLAKFVQQTDDMDEIDTYIRGLKSKSMQEDLNVDFYDRLPHDVQLYLDEFDGPWVDYGEDSDGEIYYSDEYDTYTWDTIDEFIADQRYNIREIAKQYSEHPEDFDCSNEFCELLQSIDLNESLLNEVYIGDYDSPEDDWDERYNSKSIDDDGTFEVTFNQRIRVYTDDALDWSMKPFEDDYEKYSVTPIEFDDKEIYSVDQYDLPEIVEEVLLNKVDLEIDRTPGDYAVSGVIEVPYKISGLEKYPTYLAQDEWDSTEYGYDTDNMSVTWDTDRARLFDYHIERIR